jgi:hypothetical protein
MIATGTDLGADGHLRLQPQPMAETALTQLAEQARRDLDALAHPSATASGPWPTGRDNMSPKACIC